MLLLFERQQLKSSKIFITNKDVVIQREKKKRILAPAKLLKLEIKEMKNCSKFYPNSDEIRSLEFCKQFVLTSLRLLLENVFASTN